MSAATEFWAKTCAEKNAEIERLREALKPFADEVEMADAQGYAPPDHRMLMFASDGGGTFLSIDFGCLRRAADALSHQQGPEEK